MSAGKVYLVGAGPGDPGLFTCRGRELLARADVVLYDRLAPAKLLELAAPGAELINAGKKPGDPNMTQEDVNRALIDKAREGSTVVRLKGGDPFVFGRGGEEALALAEAGVPFEIVPGVTAGVGAAAYAGIPLTHRGVAGGVVFVTGAEDPSKPASDVDWAWLARFRGTVVVYMGVGRMRGICGALVEGGRSPSTPAAVIERGTTPRQRVVKGELGRMPQVAEDHGIKAPALLVVGEVARLREKIAWFENRPLFGKTVVVTRPADRAASFERKLAELGADVLTSPAVEIEPTDDPAALEAAALDAGSFDWLVFTSGHGVEAFFDALQRAGADARALAGVQVAAVGPSTAARLRRVGVEPDLVPRRHTAAALAEAMAGLGIGSLRVMFPCADIAGDTLRTALEEAGAEVAKVVAYRTVPRRDVSPPVRRAFERRRVRWITFMSASAVRAALDQIGADTLKESGALAAAIGPATADALEDLGVSPAVVAKHHTEDGLIQSMIAFEEE